MSIQKETTKLKPIVGAVLVFLFGCAHQATVNSPSIETAPVMSSGAEASPDGLKCLSAVMPPPQLPPAEAGESALADQASADPSSDMAATEEVSGDETRAAGEAVAEPRPSVREIQQQLDEALDFCETAQDFWQKGDLESALDALDRAYSLILTVEADDPSKLVQQKEDLRFLISKRILEIYASRNIVVNGNHNAIPREINTNVQKEIDLFTKGPERQFFIEAYRRSGAYRPMILEKLAAAGLPEELSWLPLIESGFKVQALSRARALGLWQFIPSTGYKFGLKRDQYIDERIDFEKSTDAAIAYLKELHSIFGDWSTVLAAYNCGEGRVLHVIRTQKINYLDDFWDLFGRLPYETARYVPRFLAALHIIENLDKYGMSDVVIHPAIAYETVSVQRQVQLKDLAPVLGIPLGDLKALNPELRYSLLPPEKYKLRVPDGKEAVLMASISQVPLSTLPQPAFVYHRVRKGETLSVIARRYSTNVKTIMWANNLKRSSYIVAGQKLKIPQRGTVVMQAQAEQSENESWNNRHVVKRGDSLWNIANRYGTTTQKIQEMNQLTSTRLIINQVLRVPHEQSRQAEETTRGAGAYYVQQGDTPFIIARKHNMALNHFLEINNLNHQSMIYPGQKVKTE